MTKTMTLTTAEQRATDGTGERTRVGAGLANPRRLRIGHDGRPLPVPSVTTDED